MMKNIYSKLMLILSVSILFVSYFTIPLNALNSNSYPLIHLVNYLKLQGFEYNSKLISDFETEFDGLNLNADDIRVQFSFKGNFESNPSMFVSSASEACRLNEYTKITYCDIPYGSWQEMIKTTLNGTSLNFSNSNFTISDFRLSYNGKTKSYIYDKLEPDFNDFKIKDSGFISHDNTKKFGVPVYRGTSTILVFEVKGEVVKLDKRVNPILLYKDYQKTFTNDISNYSFRITERQKILFDRVQYVVILSVLNQRQNDFNSQEDISYFYVPFNRYLSKNSDIIQPIGIYENIPLRQTPSGYSFDGLSVPLELQGYIKEYTNPVNEIINILNKTDTLKDYKAMDAQSDLNRSNDNVKNDISNMNNAFNSSVSNLDLNFNLNSMGSGFINSVNFVKTSFDNFTKSSNISSVIQFNLLLGLALIFIGRGVKN